MDFDAQIENFELRFPIPKTFTAGLTETMFRVAMGVAIFTVKRLFGCAIRTFRVDNFWKFSLAPLHRPPPNNHVAYQP